jgi:hypothetical protein
MRWDGTVEAATSMDLPYGGIKNKVRTINARIFFVARGF